MANFEISDGYVANIGVQFVLSILNSDCYHREARLREVLDIGNTEFGIENGIDIKEIYESGKEIWHEVKTDQNGLISFNPKEESAEFIRLIHRLNGIQTFTMKGTGNLFIEFRQSGKEGWYLKYKQLLESETAQGIDYERTFWYVYLGGERINLSTGDREKASGNPITGIYAICLPLKELIYRVEEFIVEHGGMDTLKQDTNVWKGTGMAIPAIYFWHQRAEILSSDFCPIPTDIPNSKATLYFDIAKTRS